MRMARLVLLLFGLMFLGFGLAFAVAPWGMAQLVGLQAMSPQAVTELRAFYGGLEIGLGTFLLACAVTGRWMHAGLQCLLVICAGIAAGRVFGIAIDDSASPFIWSALATEIAGAVLAVIALRNLPAGTGAMRPPP
jgi:hypothetical protein